MPDSEDDFPYAFIEGLNKSATIIKWCFIAVCAVGIIWWWA